MVFLLGWALLRRWEANSGMVVRLSCRVKGPVRGHPWPIQKDITSRFFTMLTFSQILNICFQWMTVLSLAIVCKVESDWPTYGKSACQCDHDMAPSCTLIIPYRLSVIAQFSCQSQNIIWWDVSERLRLVLRREIQMQAGFVCNHSTHVSFVRLRGW